MSGMLLPVTYSAESLHAGQILLWRPCEGNLFKHIKQTRRTVCEDADSLLETGFAKLDFDFARACCVVVDGVPLSNLCPGLRPGAVRRGKPSLAARVIIAATERPNLPAITAGGWFSSHISRRRSS